MIPLTLIITIFVFSHLRDNRCHQGAILRYRGAPESQPSKKLEYLKSPPNGIVSNLTLLNCANFGINKRTMKT